MTQSTLESVDLSHISFGPDCDLCDQPAEFIGQGCGDKAPVLMCKNHLDRGLEVIRMYVRMWQKTNKQIMVCGHCYRPMLNLATHLEVKRLA